MTVATLASLTIRVSIALIVFALGLRVSLLEMTYLVRRPSLLLRSVVSINVVVPIITILLVASFDLHPAVGVALVMLSISPVPPLVPIKELKAGGNAQFTFSLLATEALFAVLVVPISVELLEIFFRRGIQVEPASVAVIVLNTVLAPLGAGALIRRLSPAIAMQIEKPLSLIAVVVLLAGLVPILFTAMPSIVSLLGNGTLAVIVAFIVIGLLAGHLLGGPEPQNRTVLALSTSSRHPGVALAIASAAFPEEKLAIAALLLYLMVNALVSLPYLAWRLRDLSRSASAALASEKT